MKTKSSAKSFLASLGCVLGSAITQVRGEEDKFRLSRSIAHGGCQAGKTGSFVLNMNPVVFGGML